MEQLNELFKVALVCGMSPQDYWDGDPEWLDAYYENYITAQKNDMSNVDNAAWLIGRYVGFALNDALGAAFSKGYKPQYPDEPMLITYAMDEKSKEEHDKRKREAEVMKMHERFKNMARAMQQE